MRIYISGCMTDHPDINCPAFSAEEFVPTPHPKPRFQQEELFK